MDLAGWMPAFRGHALPGDAPLSAVDCRATLPKQTKHVPRIARAPKITQTAQTAQTAHGLYIVRTGNGARHYNQGNIQWSTIRKANSAIR